MKLLLRLYPRAWRERYGAEFEALLDNEGVLRLSTIFWALQLIGFGVGLATGRFGLPPVVICRSIISVLAVMIERERRSVFSNAAPS